MGKIKNSGLKRSMRLAFRPLFARGVMRRLSLSNQ